jgi:hypothetical protein
MSTRLIGNSAKMLARAKPEKRAENSGKGDPVPSREASLRNLQKARARWRPPRPWRNRTESRVIKQLAWQWFNDKDPGKWSGRTVARWLGVSHTYIEKLVRCFSADSGRMMRTQEFRGPATFDELCDARNLTQRDRERGYLRQPRRWKLAEFKVGDEVVRAVVPTKAQERRREAAASDRVLGPTYVSRHNLPLWAQGITYFFPQNPCDPLAAYRGMIEQNHRPRPVRFSRRWRPGRPFRF